MATANAVWGIELGQCALKAIKLRPAEGGKVELVAFDLIEHPKILSQPDADRDELIRAALEKFVSRNDWQGDPFVIGVPGQQTFARFCKLPPVEPKKIPEIVRFEASQQIPFGMDDVVWDYQVFQAPETPDVEVGIFAVRKDLIRKHLEYFGAVGIVPTMIQTIPSALYNCCRFDVADELTRGSATVVVDVGAEHTDLVIVEPSSAWSRNIPLGGNNFTEALVKAFKLTFAKAENLKRTAATSKYARQIFQAMRPVFADLVAEIQRSIGFYSSTHRDVDLKTVVVCGNAFHLPGLQKYLENNLTIAGGVRRLDKFQTLVASATANAPQFTENILSFAPCYGLALQGLGLGAIAANLLPPELARAQLWRRKRPFFVAAAACLGIAAGFPWLRQWTDMQALAADRELGEQARAIVERAQSYQERYRKASKDTTEQQQKIEQYFKLLEQRALIPKLMALVHQALPPVQPPELATVQSPDELKKLIQSDPVRFARTRRQQMIIEKFEIQYSPNIDELTPTGTVSGGGVSPSVSRGRGAGAGMRPGAGLRPGGPARFAGPRPSRGTVPQEESGEGEPGFYVALEGRLLYGEVPSEAVQLIDGVFYNNLRSLGSRPGLGFYIPEKDPRSLEPGQSNFPTRGIVEPYIPQGTVSAFAGPGLRGRMGGPAAAPAAAPAGQPAGEDTVRFPDPVTGEDMSKDWRFRLGFKVKLGEPPAEQGGE